MTDYDNGERPIPQTIHFKILKLKEIETRLGHLPPAEWSIADLHRRVNDSSFHAQACEWEEETEKIFEDIVIELSKLGFTSQEISLAINEELKYPGSPKYCNAQEVEQAIKGTSN